MCSVDQTAPLTAMCRGVQQGLKDTVATSWQFFKENPLVQDVTLFDFGMQVSSSKFWNLYLAYTAARCTVLASKYAFASFEKDPEVRSDRKKNIWKQAQLYSLPSTVVGAKTQIGGRKSLEICDYSD